MKHELRIVNHGRKPKIVSVLVGDDPASVLYTSLKKAAAERMGIQFEIERFDLGFRINDLRQKVAEIGERADVTGLMVQLPVVGLQGETLKEVLASIPIAKDVDGLRYPESQVVPPVVKAIMAILDEISKLWVMNDELWDKKFVVVGAKGFVGSGVMEQLKIRGIEAIGVDKEGTEPASLPAQAGTLLVGDVVISCVGSEGIITKGMVKDGAIVIDVGAPKGDITQEVYQSASVSVEVPGGVGPVTIACLMANAMELNEY